MHAKRRRLSLGAGFSVREILGGVAAETRRDVPHVIRDRRAGDRAYLVAGPGAARERLKFRPVQSDLVTIIRTAWAWHQKIPPLKLCEGIQV
jgi:UDP-glucose 4-epimerase